jgi:hypothetical protein
MAVRRLSPTVSTVDVLDRVLDKGIVIDAEIRVAVVGIELLTINAFVRVASFETWDRYASEERRPTRPAAATPCRAAAARPATTPTFAHRVRLRCAEGCTFERRASALVLRDGALAPQRCAVKPHRACAVTLL